MRHTICFFMKPLTPCPRRTCTPLVSVPRPVRRGVTVSALAAAVACCVGCATSVGPSRSQPTPWQPISTPVVATAASEVIIASPLGVARPPYFFSRDDEQLLDDVQRGAFLYLWNECSTTTGMVHDRTSASLVSIAGVGFQLAALPVGVTRGWISHDQACERARLILTSLAGNPANRKAGLFYHFLDDQTAGPYKDAYEGVVSTIDSAILFSGIIVAGQYFGGDVQSLGDRLVREADWAFFVHHSTAKPAESGFVSLGWKPDVADEPTGEGRLLPFVWVDSGDEHRLVTFLGVCAEQPEFRLDPSLYYRLRRQLGSFGDSGPMVWFPWSGALFTSFFAHCWLDYAAMGADDPRAFGAAHRARVDWWENARRAVRLHQLKSRANPAWFALHGEHGWGLSASDTPGGYGVPGLFPDRLMMPGARPEFDYSTFNVKDDVGDGTLAPYASGCAVLFQPAEALAAMRHNRSLRAADGSPLVWKTPDADARGYGFQDAFNLEKNWVGADCVAIDQGPLLLCIENARTGMVWDLFHAHPAVQAGLTRLSLARRR